jgi:hypothetical protein
MLATRRRSEDSCQSRRRLSPSRSTRELEAAIKLGAARDTEFEPLEAEVGRTLAPN